MLQSNSAMRHSLRRDIMEVKTSLLTRAESNFEAVQLKDGRVAIIYDPKKKLGTSKSGKSNLICTTNGAVAVLDHTVSINIYKKV